MAGYPDVTAVRDWTGTTSMDISDDQLQLVIDTEVAIQEAYCYWDGDLPEPLAQALLRRCARSVAARGVPLGSLPTVSAGLGAEYGLPGAGLLPRYDAEIERFEAPWRVAGVA